MPDLRSIQAQRNAESRARWAEFAPHRRRVTDCLLDIGRLSPSSSVVSGDDTSGPSPRLCVLGAGNCNDLDLSPLADIFREIHLLDIDADALSAAADRQDVAVRNRLTLHGGIDFSGLHDCLALGESNPERLLHAIQTSPQPAILNGTFDVVASVCTLTQILEVVLDAFEPTHPLLLPLVQAIRLRHLSQLCSGLKPGGRGALITDVVSSVTCAELSAVADWQLPGLLQQLIVTRNFFTGVNPLILWQTLASGCDGRLAITDVKPLAPWTWNLGPRVYAVCGWTFQAPDL